MSSPVFFSDSCSVGFLTGKISKCWQMKPKGGEFICLLSRTVLESTLFRRLIDSDEIQVALQRVRV